MTLSEIELTSKAIQRNLNQALSFYSGQAPSNEGYARSAQGVAALTQALEAIESLRMKAVLQLVSLELINAQMTRE
jgi:hypothetical protein